MTTTIIISGQPNGNFTLRDAIQTNDCEVKQLQFGNYELIFKTKKDAVNAIRKAYNVLKSDACRVASNRERTTLIYDASSAYIFKP